MQSTHTQSETFTAMHHDSECTTRGIVLASLDASSHLLIIHDPGRLTSRAATSRSHPSTGSVSSSQAICQAIDAPLRNGTSVWAPKRNSSGTGQAFLRSVIRSRLRGRP